MAEPQDPHAPPHGAPAPGAPRAAEPPPGAQTAGVVHRNIHALLSMRREQERSRRRSARVADTITRFTGSMASVYLHLTLFGSWVVLNAGLVPGVTPFDPFPFTMLAAFASVEAIFLTTFVLISQNQQADLADQRAELDLQVGLLSEHEVTRLIRLVDAIAERLGVPRTDPEHMAELKRDVRPERVLETIQQATQDHAHEGEPR